MTRKSTGQWGEELAQAALKKKGYSILQTNYCCTFGEIDIIASYKDCLVFVEVRTKANLEQGTPEESISFTKKQHMERTALHYLQSLKSQPEDWRIDLIAVELDASGKLRRLEQIENALESWS
jgi:putative endonuclease